MTPSRMTKSDTANRVEAAVRAIIPRSTKVRIIEHGPQVDLTVNSVTFKVRWIGEGRMRQVSELLPNRRARPDIVVARRLTPGAREALSTAGVGWIDETGAAEVDLKSLVISKSGRPVSPSVKTPRWTPAVLAVAEALLCDVKATVAATKEMTGLSTGSCIYALSVLTDLGLLASEARRGRGSARRIVDTNELLDTYADAAVERLPGNALTVGVTWQDMVAGLIKAGRRWQKADVAWAATGIAAASVIAPYLTTVSTADVYVSAKTMAELEAVATEVNLRPIEGGRLTLRPFPTVTARRLAAERDGLPVVPWPRVYADLRTIGVRGEEAAEHLLEIVRDR